MTKDRMIELKLAGTCDYMKNEGKRIWKISKDKLKQNGFVEYRCLWCGAIGFGKGYPCSYNAWKKCPCCLANSWEKIDD